MPGSGVAVAPAASRPGKVILEAGMFLSRQVVMAETIWAGRGGDNRPNGRESRVSWAESRSLTRYGVRGRIQAVGGTAS